jgi:hypothetical protein
MLLQGTTACSGRRLQASQEEHVPHRRGTFRENWDQLLERFAHKGTPATREDQLRDAKSASRKPSEDVHQLLFKRSQSHGQPKQKAD